MSRTYTRNLLMNMRPKYTARLNLKPSAHRILSNAAKLLEEANVYTVANLQQILTYNAHPAIRNKAMKLLAIKLRNNKARKNSTRAPARNLNRPAKPRNRNAAARNFAKGKTVANLAKLNLKALFPNMTNANFLRVFGFKPVTKKSALNNIPHFKTPNKLKNVGVAGAPFGPSNIKKSQRKNKNVASGSRTRAQRPDVWKPDVTPFNFSLNKRPYNVEQYYKAQKRSPANAKAKIENIVRKGRMEAWEKAKLALGNKVSIQRR